MDDESSWALVILYTPLNRAQYGYFSAYHSGRSIKILPRFCRLLGLWTSPLFLVRTYVTRFVKLKFIRDAPVRLLYVVVEVCFLRVNRGA